MAKAPKLSCEVCGKDLSRDVKRGWVSWLADQHRAVVSFHVTCQGRCVAVAWGGNQTAVIGRGLMPYDQHLGAFTGIMSTKRLAQLVCDYTWPEAVLRKVADFFVLVSVLPSPPRGSVETFDEMMGGLPLAPFVKVEAPHG